MTNFINPKTEKQRHNISSYLTRIRQVVHRAKTQPFVKPVFNVRHTSATQPAIHPWRNKRKVVLRDEEVTSYRLVRALTRNKEPAATVLWEADQTHQDREVTCSSC